MASRALCVDPECETWLSLMNGITFITKLPCHTSVDWFSVGGCNSMSIEKFLSILEKNCLVASRENSGGERSARRVGQASPFPFGGASRRGEGGSATVARTLIRASFHKCIMHYGVFAPVRTAYFVHRPQPTECIKKLPLTN